MVEALERRLILTRLACGALIVIDVVVPITDAQRLSTVVTTTHGRAEEQIGTNGSTLELINIAIGGYTINMIAQRRNSLALRA